MRLVVTNDDGIEAEGIHVLARHLHAAGHDVLVVAPHEDQSGTGASLGRLNVDNDVSVDRVELPGCPDVPAYAVAGPPGLAVMAANLGAFGPAPDAVVSGINAGYNTGRAILHSGTVGAALTAQNFGISGLAVSAGVGEPFHFDTAAELAVEVVAHQLMTAPPRSVLNLNVPPVPRVEVKGIRWAKLASFGAVRASVADASTGRLQIELVATEEQLPPDSDSALVHAGYATLTTLVGLVEAWPPFGEHAVELGVEERIVPGAPLEAVHDVPDASHSRHLHRPFLDQPPT